ncbi:MAG: 50S ribosomal protein L9 [Solirubrobacteraceae bacterium]|jgi:large subunit ribosomal protein L9|nr:50S ribosomal protein L9 [Solirubrobacteraceae bacterium]MCU0313767.1 50S ribosomal protein L9 [Solirubrobacteraceae bacterium]
MPEAILLQDVETLGAKGTVVDVSKGYLRNYLIPRKLAQPATRAGLAAAAQASAAHERALEHQAAQSAELAELLGKTVLTIARQAGDDGRLFGSVTNADVAEAIKEARGVDVDRRKIHLDEPIKQIGTYVVELELEGGVAATVKTMVVEQ